MVKEINYNYILATKDYSRHADKPNGDVVYLNDEVTIDKNHNIWNSYIFYNKLIANVVYRLTIDNIILLDGNASDITFAIKNISLNRFVLTKNLALYQKNIVFFATADDVSDLELKVYSGRFGEANENAIKIFKIKLEIISEHHKNDIFFTKIEQLYWGYQTAIKYCSLDENVFYIIANRHIGDAVRLFGFLKPFKEYYGKQDNEYHLNTTHPFQISDLKKRKLVKKIIVLTTLSISGVAKLYKDIDDIVILSKDELLNLEAYSLSAAAIHHNLIPDEEANYWIGNSRYESSHARSILLGVDDHLWNFVLPKNLKKADMEITQTTIDSTAEVIKKYCIDINNTVIICPRAQSSSILDYDVWEEFAKLQKNLGKRVFTNIASNEKPVHNTEGLTLSIDCLCCLISLGCRIIGMQSGLMDVFVKYGHNLDLTIIHSILWISDKQFAQNRRVLDTINRSKNLARIRIENFDRNYVVKLLDDVFNKRDLALDYVLPQPEKSETNAP